MRKSRTFLQGHSSQFKTGHVKLAVWLGGTSLHHVQFDEFIDALSTSNNQSCINNPTLKIPVLLNTSVISDIQYFQFRGWKVYLTHLWNGSFEGCVCMCASTRACVSEQPDSAVKERQADRQSGVFPLYVCVWVRIFFCFVFLNSSFIFLGGCQSIWAGRPSKAYVGETLQNILFSGRMKLNGGLYLWHICSATS